MEPVDSLAGFALLRDKDPFVLGYFSRPGCGVCSALWPRVAAMVDALPRAVARSIDLDLFPGAAGVYSIFTVPAVLVFVDGKESIREARHIDLRGLRGSVERLYRLRFDGLV
jgi:thiol-disulfide isomerase/thioredoxin